MRPHIIGAALGALIGLGVAESAQALPGNMGRASVVGESASLVTKTHGRNWCNRRGRHVHRYRYYRPRSYSYRAYRPRYSARYAPRYYYRPHYYRTYSYRTHSYRPYGYRSYGYRPYYRTGFSFWW